MAKLNPKLIIFDWDDVLTLGAKEGYFSCYDFALWKVGVSLPENIKTERILKRWGTNHREELIELLKENPNLVDDAAKAYEEAFFGDVFVNSLTILAGTADTLQKLSKRYKLAVATGGHPKIIKERIILKFGIPEVFETILSGYDIHDPTKTKPNPFMLNTIMDKVRVTSTETIYVGDAGNDVLMAQNAGIEPVVVLTGHLSESKAKELGAKYILPDVTLIESVLEY